MDYYCETCDKFISHKSEYKLFESIDHKELKKCRLTIISLKIIDMNLIDEAFYFYIVKHNKTFDYYLVKCQFKLISNEYEYCPIVTSKLSDKKQWFLGQIFFRENN